MAADGVLGELTKVLGCDSFVTLAPMLVMLLHTGVAVNAIESPLAAYQLLAETPSELCYDYAATHAPVQAVLTPRISHACNWQYQPVQQTSYWQKALLRTAGMVLLTIMQCNVVRV